jgi:hypothetical protein
MGVEHARRDVKPPTSWNRRHIMDNMIKLRNDIVFDKS